MLEPPARADLRAPEGAAFDPFSVLAFRDREALVVIRPLASPPPVALRLEGHARSQDAFDLAPEPRRRLERVTRALGRVAPEHHLEAAATAGLDVAYLEAECLQDPSIDRRPCHLEEPEEILKPRPSVGDQLESAEHAERSRCEREPELRHERPPPLRRGEQAKQVRQPLARERRTAEGVARSDANDLTGAEDQRSRRDLLDWEDSPEPQACGRADGDQRACGRVAGGVRIRAEAESVRARLPIPWRGATLLHRPTRGAAPHRCRGAFAGRSRRGRWRMPHAGRPKTSWPLRRDTPRPRAPRRCARPPRTPPWW